MRNVARRLRAHKHHESLLFASSNGAPRMSAAGRGGWRRPTPLELALSAAPQPRSAHQEG